MESIDKREGIEVIPARKIALIQPSAAPCQHSKPCLPTE
jgi:hypothetical protein